MSNFEGTQTGARPQYVGTHQGGSLFPFRHTLLRELVVEACMSYV